MIRYLAQRAVAFIPTLFGVSLLIFLAIRLVPGDAIVAMLGTVSAQQNEIFVKENAAINGYDPVAYFTEGKPLKGRSDFSVQYKGATWLFVNKTNADLFKATPGKV